MRLFRCEFIYINLPQTDIPPLDLTRKNVIDDIIYREGSTSNKTLFLSLPHKLLLQFSLPRGKNLYQSFHLSPPFCPGYLSAPKDSKKVRAQLKIQRTTGYASRGTDRDPVSYTRYNESACYRSLFDPFVIFHRTLSSAINYPEDVSFRRRS